MPGLIHTQNVQLSTVSDQELCIKCRFAYTESVAMFTKLEAWLHVHVGT